MPDEEVTVIFCYGCESDSDDDYKSEVRDLAPFEDAILEGRLLPL